MSRDNNKEAVVYDAKVPIVEILKVVPGCGSHQFFGRIVKVLESSGAKDGKEKVKLESLMSISKMKNERSYYSGKLGVPNEPVCLFWILISTQEMVMISGC